MYPVKYQRASSRSFDATSHPMTINTDNLNQLKQLTQATKHQQKLRHPS